MFNNFKVFFSPRESVGSYATLVATYVASFTIVQFFLKAADLGLETTDGLLKLTANKKVRLCNYLNGYLVICKLFLTIRLILS